MTRDPWYPGGPPQTGPDFAKGREALDRFDGFHGVKHLACSCARCQDAATVRVTLDQAEKEIARLREENQRLLEMVLSPTQSGVYPYPSPSVPSKEDAK